MSFANKKIAIVSEISKPCNLFEVIHKQNVWVPVYLEIDVDI